MLRRKPWMKMEEFNAYFRDHHGPLVAGHQARLGMLRYVQTLRDPASHAIEETFHTLRNGMEPPYDGVAETWWASEAALADALSSEAGQMASNELLENEARFIDHAASPLWMAHEYPQVVTQRDRIVARPRTGILKMFYLLRQPEGMSTEAAQAYWHLEHGPIVRSYAVARGMMAYQQVHRYDSTLVAPMAAARGVELEPYFGHAEVWFDRLVPRVGPEVSESAGALLTDEAKFIDFSRSTGFIGRELLFVDRDWGAID
jgi:hypothetical protein